MQGLNIGKGAGRESDAFETAPLSSSSEDNGGMVEGGFLSRARQKHVRLGWANVTIGVLLLLVLGLVVVLFRCGGKDTLESVESSLGSSLHKKEDDVIAAFLVVGDWGRRGAFNQTDVARAMGAKADLLHPQFIISTGDNFYPHGLNSTYDREFDYSYRHVYNATSLQVPWYAVLGNHDYGDGSDDAAECLRMDGGCPRGPLPQLDAELVRRDSRWHCARLYSLSLADGKADLFFMDTSPLVQRYHDEPWAKFKEGISAQSWESQLRELESMLARSAAEWKVLIAHHPVRSNGEHGDTEEMRALVQPLLQRYGVRAAFHGHDHDLEHLHVQGEAQHYFVSGAGSETREMHGTKDALWQWPASGFTAVTIKHEEMIVEFHGIASSSSHHQGGGGGGGSGGGSASKPMYVARIPRSMNATGW